MNRILSVVLLGVLMVASSTAASGSGLTAIHRAVRIMAVWDLEVLLANGGNPDEQDGFGNTPLHHAANLANGRGTERDATAIMRILLKAGANPNIRNIPGDAPLHLTARTYGSTNVSGVEALLAAGANPNIADREGNTPLHVAVTRSLERKSRFEAAVVKALLDGGANPKALGRDRLPPLLLFVRDGPDEGRIVTLLVNAGADPNRKGPDGDTPLHTAIRTGGSRGKARVVDALLAGGADPCIEDSRGGIPYTIATKGGDIHRALDRADGDERACDSTAGGGALAAAQTAADTMSPEAGEERRQAEAERKAWKAEAVEIALGLPYGHRREIQESLAAAGFDPGPADGVFWPRTREAIRGWQAARNAGATGYLTEEQARALSPRVAAALGGGQ